MVAVLVDRDVVVVPAQGGEVVGVVGTAVGPGNDVVGFEPETGTTPGDGAAPVAFGDKSPDVRRDMPSGMRRRDRLAVLGDDDAYLAPA